jgi:hypothetical protein
MSYRTRIRTPSFAHLQMPPALAPGMTVADLVVQIASDRLRHVGRGPMSLPDTLAAASAMPWTTTAARPAPDAGGAAPDPGRRGLGVGRPTCRGRALLGVTNAELDNLATFYSLIFRRPWARR